MLTMQADGNLVLYCIQWRSSLTDPSRLVPYRLNAAWSSGTWNSGTFSYAKFQTDGNFVVYNAYSALAIQDDSNVVIYDRLGFPIWSTNTWHAC